MRFETEQALAEAVSDWMADNGWDVYHEVTKAGGCPRADIVGTCGRLVWVVECKLSLSLSVMAQAVRWIGRAHYVSVAVPSARESNARWFAKDTMRRRGIGVITAKFLHDVEKAWYRWDFEPPTLHRRAVVSDLRKRLVPQQKATAPGTKGAYHTPFRETISRVSEAVKKSPAGMTIREVVDYIDHHYATDQSARQSLLIWADEGKVPGIVVDRSVRPTRLIVKGSSDG